ncbi:hypothetical protein G134_1539 [Lactobacillus delbrueckii subsp. lactis CRL581]|nr:hypothetical protein G134_1539 [Lactobacillus delbrueckii subsp. lactis CRL581]
MSTLNSGHLTIKHKLIGISFIFEDPVQALIINRSFSLEKGLSELIQSGVINLMSNFCRTVKLWSSLDVILTGQLVNEFTISRNCLLFFLSFRLDHFRFTSFPNNSSTGLSVTCSKSNIDH